MSATNFRSQYPFNPKNHARQEHAFPNNVYALTFMAAGPAQVAAGQSTLPERPNIIFIMLDDIDGVSVVPSLLSKPQAELRERPLYWEFHKGNFQQAARLGDWKAVRGAPDKPIELYHLAQDIAERDNIADDHPDQVAWFERFLSKAPFLLT